MEVCELSAQICMEAASQAEDAEEARGLLRLDARYGRKAAADADGTSQLIIPPEVKASSLKVPKAK